MSKELESLKILDYYNDLKKCWGKEFDIVEQALNELQAIKNSNPNEALKALKSLGEILGDLEINENTMLPKTVLSGDRAVKYKIVEQSLLKTQKQEKENDELKKVLSIIKEKDVNIWYLAVSTKVKNYKDYNSFLMNDKNKRQLTEEEFDLLRRYFKYD